MSVVYDSELNSDPHACKALTRDVFPAKQTLTPFQNEKKNEFF